MIQYFDDVGTFFVRLEKIVSEFYKKLPLGLRVIVFSVLFPILLAYFTITRLTVLLYKTTKFTFRPFRVISHHFLSFFIWIAFTLFGGLMGIIVNLCRNLWFVNNNPLRFHEALAIEMSNGSFYTYSIAIVAAVLCTLLTIFLESKKEELNFRRYQIVIVSFSVFTIVFGGIFYALSKAKGVIDNNTSLDTGWDWQQLTVFLMALVLSVYSFCVVRLNDHKEEFKDLIDKSEQDLILDNEDLNIVEAKNYSQKND